MGSSDHEGSLQWLLDVHLVTVADSLRQIWPDLPGSRAAQSWFGPPLLVPKVVTLLRLLEQRNSERACQDYENEWAALVFVKTKVSAVVLSKLLQSCPDVRRRLPSGHLIGNTEPGGGTSRLSMDNKAQRKVMTKFKKGDINLLVATNIGMEGLDFRNCQLVVAFEPPPNVEGFIQARGRARHKHGEYCWLVPSSFSERRQVEGKRDSLLWNIEIMDDMVAHASAATRTKLQQAPNGLLLPPRQSAEEHHPAHLVIPGGGTATARLAQPILAGFCAKLPGCDRHVQLQAYYSTTQDPQSKGFRSTIFLPSSSGLLEPITPGVAEQSRTAAKNRAALLALTRLRAEGKIDDCMMPVWKSNRHSAQLEAEIIPPFYHDVGLLPPLDSRSITSHDAASKVGSANTIIMHLHKFQVRNCSSSNTTTTTTTRAGSTEDVLSLAVGAAKRQEAVPRRGSQGHGSQDAPYSSFVNKLKFGVLMWAPLPGADIGSEHAAAAAASVSASTYNQNVLMQWPAWMSRSQQQPSQVTVAYEGPLELTSEMLGWSLSEQADGDGAATVAAGKAAAAGRGRPLNPSFLRQRLGTADAVAAATLSPAAAASALQGAQVVLRDDFSTRSGQYLPQGGKLCKQHKDSSSFMGIRRPSLVGKLVNT
eukprot:gene10787-10944_t